MYFGYRLKIYYCTICVFRRKGLAEKNNVTASRKIEERKKKGNYLKETLRVHHDRNTQQATYVKAFYLL